MKPLTEYPYLRQVQQRLALRPVGGSQQLRRLRRVHQLLQSNPRRRGRPGADVPGLRGILASQAASRCPPPVVQRERNGRGRLRAHQGIQRLVRQVRPGRRGRLHGVSRRTRQLRGSLLRSLGQRRRLRPPHRECHE